jgi:prepilin-type N-terminal cleavage/methylation domain-containing protein
MMNNNEKGFTLVEVLLAVMLLGVALIPIMNLMPSMYSMNENMIIENKLTFFAQDKLEEVKSLVIADISVDRNESSQPFPNDSSYRYNVIDDGGTDIDSPTDGNVDIKMITIQAWYGDSLSTYVGAEHKIELKTKVSYRNS